MAWSFVFIAFAFINVNEIIPSADYLNIEKHALDYGAVVFSTIMLFWWVFVVNDAWVRDAADSYALRLLAVCEDLSKVE